MASPSNPTSLTLMLFMALLLLLLTAMASLPSPSHACDPGTPSKHHPGHNHHSHYVPTPSNPSFPTPTTPSVPSPTTPSSPSGGGTCPIDIVKLNVCVPLLGGLLANPLQSDCCALLGIIGLDIEVCLCAALDANVLGIITIHIKRLDVIATILTTCGQQVPPKLSCPS